MTVRKQVVKKTFFFQTSVATALGLFLYAAHTADLFCRKHAGLLQVKDPGLSIQIVGCVSVLHYTNLRLMLQEKP